MCKKKRSDGSTGTDVLYITVCAWHKLYYGVDAIQFKGRWVELNTLTGKEETTHEMCEDCEIKFYEEHELEESREDQEL